MVKINKEKVALISKFLSGFFKSYLPEIVFLVFVFQLLVSLNALPYFNIISKYYYYVTAILWILLNVLFKRHITNKKILIVGIVIFILAIPFVILDLNSVSDALGFLSFLMLITYVLREIFIQKSQLSTQ